MFSLSFPRDLVRPFIRLRHEIRSSDACGVERWSASDISACSPKREGDAFYILGGSRSINNLSPLAWQEIGNSYSIGINNWFVHSFVPTYLLVEGWRPRDLNTPAYFHFIESLGNYLQSEDVTLLIKNFGIHYFPVSELKLAGRKNIYSVPKLEIPGRSNGEVAAAMHYANKLGLQKRFVLFSRVSVVMAMSIGYLMGFRQIVLCGVDLRDGKYFWEEPDFKPHRAVTPPPASGQVVAARHSTVSPAINPVTADASIFSFNERILKPSGVQLYVSSEESALYPQIAAYRFSGPL